MCEKKRAKFALPKVRLLLCKDGAGGESMLMPLAPGSERMLPQITPVGERMLSPPALVGKSNFL